MRPRVAAALCTLCVFVWLAAEVMGGRTVRFDENARALIHQWSAPPLTAAMKEVSVMGSAAVSVPLILAALLLFRRKLWRPTVLLLATAGGAGLLDQILKHLFIRARPEPFFGITASHLSSFPSGHALLASYLYAALASTIAARVSARWLRAAVWCAAILLIAAIGFSRVYLGEHYPTDVLAGYAAGCTWFLAVSWALDQR